MGTVSVQTWPVLHPPSTSHFQYCFLHTMSLLGILIIISTSSIHANPKQFLIETDDVGDTIQNKEIDSVIQNNVTDVMIHEVEDYRRKKRRLSKAYWKKCIPNNCHGRKNGNMIAPCPKKRDCQKAVKRYRCLKSYSRRCGRFSFPRCRFCPMYPGLKYGRWNSVIKWNTGIWRWYNMESRNLELINYFEMEFRVWNV